MKTDQGRGLLESYNNKNVLSPQDRTDLVHKTVQYLIENRKKITVKRCEILAEEIVKIFPTESLVRLILPLPIKHFLIDFCIIITTEYVLCPR